MKNVRLLRAPRVSRLLLLAALPLAPLSPAASAADAAQRVMLADFEDVGTWRMTGSAGLAPGAWFSGTVFLGGAREAARSGDYGGELRFAFDEDGNAARRLSFRRQKMRRVSGFLDGIEFEADARGHPGTLRFVLQDGANKRFHTRPAGLDGAGWKKHRVEINASTIKDHARIKFPVLVDEIIFETARGGAGSVHLDDIVATGTFTRRDTIAIRPVYDGLATLPGEALVAKYRIRNGRPDAVELPLRWTLAASDGPEVFSAGKRVAIPAFGEAEVAFDAGPRPVGAYEALVRAEHAGVELLYEDSLGVFQPNNRRLNRSPMWFGVQDNTVWQAEGENRLHIEWMRALGVDIHRMGTTAGRFRKELPLSQEGWRRLMAPFEEAGIDTVLMYFETPPWLVPTGKSVRSAPADLKAFEDYAEDYGRFFSGFKGVRYVEFWNEPDIGFFHGTTDEYLAMLSAFGLGMRRGAPDIRIGSGGVTVLHPREKKDFSARMYQEGGDDYDIAIFHAHGPLGNYVERQRLVEGWLAKAGLDKPIANTESGERSGYNAAGRRKQAAEVLKKMAYSKARARSEFHVWFTLQDYWDMDPEADDSFGLVTSDNRPKPSFVAYNEVIRRLSNTRPVPVDAAGDVALHAFSRADGRHVYVAWPAGGKGGAALRFRADSPVEVVSMFGRDLATLPASSAHVQALGADPVYLESPSPLVFLRADELPLAAPAEIYRDPTAPTRFEASVRNTHDSALRGKVALRDANGATAWEEAVEVAPRSMLAIFPVIPADHGDSAASDAFTLDLHPEGSAIAPMSLPVYAAGSHPIARVAPGAFAKNLAALPAIRLDAAKDVFELSFDPSIPAWRGAADLSVETRLAHDGENLHLRFEVKDDRHVQAGDGGQLWRSDSVQLAFFNPANRAHVLLDLGLAKGGPAVWCHQGLDADDKGPWSVPVDVRRTDGLTTYQATLPLARLGFGDFTAPAPIRFALLVNEDDGQGRVRWMHWFGGLGKSHDVDGLGYGILK